MEPEGTSEAVAIGDLAATAHRAAQQLQLAVERKHPQPAVQQKLAEAAATISQFHRESHAKGRNLKYQVDAWYRERNNQPS
jgi:hypothetical protein